MQTEVVVMNPDRMAQLCNKVYSLFEAEKLSAFEGYAVLKYSKLHMEETLGIKHTMDNFSGEGEDDCH